MEDITTYLDNHGSSSITEIADGVDRDRHVVSRDLRVLEERGVATHREHGPSTQWKLAANPLANKLERDDILSESLASVLTNLPGTISIHDETNSIRWSTTDGVGHPRQCHLFHQGRQDKCPSCPIQTVQETRRPMSFTTEWQDTKKHITLIPVNDSIVEHIA